MHSSCLLVLTSVFFFFFLMIRRPPRSTLSSSSAASDVYKRQLLLIQLTLHAHPHMYHQLHDLIATSPNPNPNPKNPCPNPNPHPHPSPNPHPRQLHHLVAGSPKVPDLLPNHPTPDPNSTSSTLSTARPGCPVRPDVRSTDQVLRLSTVWATPIRSKPRILCYVQTLSSQVANMMAVNETWGGGCDGLVFFVNTRNPDLNLWQVSLGLPGDGVKSRLARKSALVVQWLARHLLQQYDWFAQFDDDTYVFMPNLRKYLLTMDHTTPLLIGRRFKKSHLRDFAHGSAYVLSNQAVKMLACRLGGCDKPGTKPLFVPLTSAEDLIIADELRALGVWPVDTRDECGGERFHPFQPRFMTAGAALKQWYQRYSYNLETGMGCCSTEPISYHPFKNSAALLLFHKEVLLKVTPSEWPSSRQAIAAYDVRCNQTNATGAQ
eukprot:TRINITY_DN11779_c0_g1_i1.p1 TRINITY_DN11779_c0_g1~~TRINITY_DN11779_c0_g1_i1.p1  ORF type:complete len:434 (-),score=76.12 TRINITY_DN11779_c0_g1_i1:277-1578(-)